MLIVRHPPQLSQTKILHGGESPLAICDDNNEIADGKGLGAIQSSAVSLGHSSSSNDDDGDIEDGKGLGAIQSSAVSLGHGGCKVLLPLSWTFPTW